MDGLKEAVAALDALEKSVRKKLLRKAAVAGGKIVMTDYKNAVRRREGGGLLARSIGHKTKAYQDTVSDIVGARVGIEGTYKGVKEVPVNIAHLVELGTRPHSLARDAKLARRGKADAGQESGARHPGAKAYPALIPARTRNAKRIVDVMTDILATGIDDLAKGGAA